MTSATALSVYQALGCAGFARVDLMLDPDAGALYVLELNPIPGLTETSLLPQAADAAGIAFDELIERIVAAVPADPARPLTPRWRNPPA
jgi:D-alanine-D-alanine ligase